MRLQEGRNVPRDRGVGLERQTDFPEARHALPHGTVGRLTAGKETIDQQVAHAAAIHFDGDGSADQLPPPSKYRDAVGRRAVRRQQRLLGGTA